jgi:N-acetylmuramoyl-L-alanine amidase
MNKRFLRLSVTAVLASLALFGFSNSVHASEDFSSIKGKKIVLDAGHGGKDPGAVKNGYYEKNLNIQLTEKLAVRLEKMGAEVIYTRNPSDDIFIEIEERPEIANQLNADIFISIHHNSNDSSTPKGTSTHYSSFRPGVETNDVYVEYNKGKYKYLREAEINDVKGFYINYNGKEKFVSNEYATAFDPTPSDAAQKGKILSEKIVNAMASLGLENDGAKDHNLYVTKATNMPSLLIEAGYMSNSAEINKIANPAFQDSMAEKIASSVLEYFNEYYPAPKPSGWIKGENGKWSYYDPETGEAKKGWAKIDNTWYFFNTSGIMATGWLKEDNVWYYLQSTGAMKTGWLMYDNKWFYLQPSGVMATGWRLLNGKWYYMYEDGHMATGWALSKGKWYYLYEDGHMASNTTINGFKLGEDGAWIQ